MSGDDECVAGCPFTEDALQRLAPFQLPPMELLDTIGVKRFEYQRLHPWQTRIIKLVPGRPEDPLDCELVVADLILASKAVGIAAWSRICTYEAISYSWGWPERDYEIGCNGKSIRIPPSLADALQYLRHPTDPRLLWCDALCINQDDPDEKASQVQKMFIIFKSATGVIGWLGKADDHCMMFCDISRLQQERRLNNVESARSLYRLEDHSKSCVTRMRKDVSLFLERSLFHRLWIRQEVAAAESFTLQCGTLLVDFVSFMRFIQPFVRDHAGGRPTSSLTVLQQDFHLIESVQAKRSQGVRSLSLCHIQ